MRYALIQHNAVRDQLTLTKAVNFTQQQHFNNDKRRIRRRSNKPMTSTALNELYVWAKNQINQPIMLGCALYKVNSQTPGQLLLLLREPTAPRAHAEIEVLYNAELNPPYQAIFSPLPFTTGSLFSTQRRPAFETARDVMYWIKTGQGRVESV